MKFIVFAFSILISQMNNLLAIALILSSTSSFAQGIGNFFQVDREGQVFRGKEPKEFATDLKRMGITDVLIFKNETKNEVSTEIANLSALKIKSYHIPFKWKNFESVQVACEQVVDALNIIHRVKASRRSIFFHCSLGEDRTGMLAGLYRMLEEGANTQDVFFNEMCARGYSDGNPKKPGMVYGAIQKELTPLFLAIAQKIEQRQWTLGRINRQSCMGLTIAPTKLRCRR